MSRKIIIDADPGIDDAFAIVMAHYEKSLEVLAIHTVAGNVNLENTTRNAQGLVKRMYVSLVVRIVHLFMSRFLHLKYMVIMVSVE